MFTYFVFLFVSVTGLCNYASAVDLGCFIVLDPQECDEDSDENVYCRGKCSWAPHLGVHVPAQAYQSEAVEGEWRDVLGWDEAPPAHELKEQYPVYCLSEMACKCVDPEDDDPDRRKDTVADGTSSWGAGGGEHHVEDPNAPCEEPTSGGSGSGGSGCSGQGCE